MLFRIGACQLDNKTIGFANKIISKLEGILNALQTSRRGQDDEPATSNTSHAGDKANGASRKVPLAAHISSAPIPTDELEKKWYKTFNGCKSRVELVAFIFAIGYAIVTYFQWRDAHSSFLLDQRPWISFSNVKLSPGSVGKPVVASINVINFGKAPARNPMIRFRIEVLKIEQSPTLDFSKDVKCDLEQTPIIWPGRSVDDNSFYARDPSTGDRLLLTQEQLDEMHAGRIYVAMYAHAEYKDSANKRHWSNYCATAFTSTAQPMEISVNSRACTEYNNADSDY